MSKFATRGIVLGGLGVAAVAAVVVAGAAHAEGHRGHGFGARGGDGEGRGARLERMFERADVNGDGVVTMEEIEEARALIFAEIDADGDGGVTGEELVAWRMRERAERVVARFDENGDGVLSIEETPFRAGRLSRFDLDDDGQITRAELELVQEMRGGRRGGPRHFWRGGRHGGQGDADDGALD